MSRTRVVIIGGGFAGLACANALDSARFAVTLVDRKGSFEFLPNIHELLSGVKKPKQLRLSLRSNLRAQGHRFVRGEVTGIEPDTGEVVVDDDKSLSADYLVVAAGSADADYGVSGVGKHTYGFKSVDQCQAIHRRLQTLSRAKKTPQNIVIIGGGLEGIEGLGEILRAYAHAPFQLSLVEARDRLLPAGPAAVARHIAEHCSTLGVACITSDPAARITAKTVFLNSGRKLRSDLTIWTGGPAPPALLADSGLAEKNRWVPVDENLRHPAYEHIFVAGDAAELQQPISKQAYHALDMGRCIANNIERLSAGKAPRRYRPSDKPTLLAFGDIDSILVTSGPSLAGPALAAAKESVFATVMAQLDQRSRLEKIDAVWGRGRQATEQLLWPALRNWRDFNKQAKVQKIS